MCLPLLTFSYLFEPCSTFISTFDALETQFEFWHTLYIFELAPNPSAGVAENVCKADWEDCAEQLDDVCRFMGSDYDVTPDGMRTTEWQNVSCRADEYVACDQVQFGAVNGHRLDVTIMQVEQLKKANTSCYHLSRRPYFRPTEATYQDINATALSQINFRVRCQDLLHGGDPTSDDGGLAK